MAVSASATLARWRLARVGAAPAAVVAGVAALRAPDLAPALVPVAALAGLLSLATPLGSEGHSMWPTLARRTRGVVLARSVFPVRRGDVVAAVAPDGEIVVKRVVARGGDHVTSTGGELRNRDLPVSAYRSRMPLDTTWTDRGTGLRWDVPRGAVFLLGDHVSSRDSRHFGPIPLDRVLGRYVAVTAAGDPPIRPPLSDEDAEDLARVQAGGEGAALDRLLEAGGWRPVDLGVALVIGLEAVGEPARAAAALGRLAAVASPDERPWWLARQADRCFPLGDYTAVVALTAEAGPPHDADRLRLSLRANALSRLGRFAEALAVAEAWEARFPEEGPSGPALASLVGLGRFAEAEARVQALAREDGACWAPWYRGLIAVARGDLAAGGALVAEALRAGFPDPGWARGAPLLAPLRASAHWAPVEAALAAVAERG